MAADPGADTSLQRQIQEEQIAILFRHLPLTLTSNLLLACGVVWALWDIADHNMLLAWLSLIALLVLFRFGIVLGYRRKQPGNTVPWHIYFTIATLLGGAAWGSAGVLFFIPDSPLALIFVTIILAAIAAGSVPAYSSWMPAQYAVIPTTLPIALRYLAEGGDFLLMGFMSLLYPLNLLAAARRLSQVLAESIRLRLENEQLVERLREEMLSSEQARARAEEASRAKSKFLAAASHDLRQPLHAANLFLEALRQEPNPARATALLENLDTSTRALGDLLHELLDISKLEAGLFQPQFQNVELQLLFDALESELRPLAEARGLELGFVATRARVRSDPQMLGRVLRNMITNAIRHSERGAVLVGCRRKPNGVAIAVYDTGPGIAPEHHQAIFREFYQIGNTERNRHKGLGLGLAIVDGLCRILGHTLSLRSRVGHGSAFFVGVPLASDDDVPCESAQETVLADIQGLAVLVIDDDPDIRDAMSEVLARWGCQVHLAATQQEAMDALTAEVFAPDAIIADYRLPAGQTGAQAIAAIRELLGRQLPAVIITGDTATERLQEANASGAILLHKPLHPARLRNTLALLRTITRAA